MFFRGKVAIYLVLATLASAIFYSTFFSPIIDAGSSKYKQFTSVKTHKILDGIYQHREGVVKDMWVSKDGERLLYHVESPSSQFRWEGDEMVETLNQLALWIHDKDIRYLKATQGVFHYKKKLLEAHGAFLSSYTTSEDYENPYFQGLAKELSFHFRTYPPTVTTKGFSAHYSGTFFSSDEIEYHDNQVVLHGNVKVKHGDDLRISSDRLIWSAKRGHLEIQGDPKVEGEKFGILSCDSSLYFDLGKKEITAENQKHPLVFSRSQMKILSNKITLAIEKSKASKITFSDDVRLLNSTIVGIADKAIYDFNTHAIQLLAGPGEDVYFWNQSKNFTLAAPLIHIEGEEVRGIGKVRFTFEESEKENILKLLEACLKTTY